MYELFEKEKKKESASFMQQKWKISKWHQNISHKCRMLQKWKSFINHRTALILQMKRLRPQEQSTLTEAAQQIHSVARPGPGFSGSELCAFHMDAHNQVLELLELGCARLP